MQAPQTPWTLSSPSKTEWDRRKQNEGASNQHVDVLMNMPGLEAVKEQFLNIMTRVDTCRRQGTNLRSERFGTVLLGNPGTGKTTVGQLYAKFLVSTNLVPGSHIEETTAARLIAGGVKQFVSDLDVVKAAGGGVVVVDEAHQLAATGGHILDFLLPEMENLTGQIIFILAGYKKPMDKLFAHSQGLASRFPYQFQFEDYTDAELLCILKEQIRKHFNGQTLVDGGLDGLYCRIVARRIGYGRGREGFGNVRTLQATFSRILNRQARRLAQNRREGKFVPVMELTKTDLIGPEPATTLTDNSAWKKLQDMVGLDAVKHSVKAFIQVSQFNYHRELEEKPILKFSLNKVFLGSPGTGKTTVAKLWGQILVDMNFLSTDEVVTTNPSDFIGAAIGHSEQQTKDILASTAGKVLVIDEAYGLNENKSGSSSGGFKAAVIDTLVAEVQSAPGDDRCVILIGYKDQMEEMFQKANPGLSRRFPLSDAFNFEDFTNEQLKMILLAKLKQQGYEATDQAITVAMEVLERTRNRPNFGNAGEVDILLNTAKLRYLERISRGGTTSPGKGNTGGLFGSDAERKASEDVGTLLLDAVDMDPDFHRGEKALANIRELFKGVVGCDETVEMFEGFQKLCLNMRARGLEAREWIPFNMLFRGPPGTGKTSSARKIGKIYYDMGLLATPEVVETSTTELVAGYVGQTGPKTQKLFEKALGKVLFIDEAYRLAYGAHAREAVDELVDCLTKPRFRRRLIVILAGYDADINTLLSQNPGLSSRFPDTVNFRDFTASECLELFVQRFRELMKKADINFDFMRISGLLLRWFESLVKTANWANARDVEYLADLAFRKIMSSSENPSVSMISQVFTAMLAERISRGTNLSKRNERTSNAPAAVATADQPHDVVRCESKAETKTEVKTESKTEIKAEIKTESKTTSNQTSLFDRVTGRHKKPSASPTKQTINKKEISKVSRDPGVDKVTWQVLEHDKKHAAFQEQKLRSQEAELDRLKRRPALATKAEQKKRDELQQTVDSKKIQKEKEAIAQQKLQSMGKCVQGFHWIKQTGGYRCAGGSHFVYDIELS
ncbi:P-loop containing nucleoside triphosphate hydrolase protein, partial [Aureobasidium melanogenum]